MSFALASLQLIPLLVLIGMITAIFHGEMSIMGIEAKFLSKKLEAATTTQYCVFFLENEERKSEMKN